MFVWFVLFVDLLGVVLLHFLKLRFCLVPKSFLCLNLLDFHINHPKLNSFKASFFPVCKLLTKFFFIWLTNRVHVFTLNLLPLLYPFCLLQGIVGEWVWWALKFPISWSNFDQSSKKHWVVLSSWFLSRMISLDFSTSLWVPMCKN